MHDDPSLPLTSPTTHLTAAERAGLALVGAGLVLLLAAAFGAASTAPGRFLAVAVAALSAGTFLYVRRHLRRPAGVDNDGLWFSSATAKGALGWVMAVAFTGFYVLLYWWPAALAGLVRLFDPLADAIGYPEGVAARRWVMYGSFYTLAVLVMGVRAMVKYRHNRYQVVRTGSVMFFQLGFAFVLPYALVRLNQPEFYPHYFWPLKYDYLWPGATGWLTPLMFGFAAFMIFVVTPVLTFFFGKRWYCSWVCGCGALAETAGDPFRHLSDPSLRAWRIERWTVHGVLALIVAGTALLWIDRAAGGVLGGLSGAFSQGYGFFIGLIFSGVVGVGFYPILGNRVWCRFGCPMAAVLGLQQRFFSRFRITTNGGQCISCGNCTTYCEMGIDVRWYAQRGQHVVRASCVGCGICAAVCPRGVLKLENGPHRGRAAEPAFIDRDAVGVLSDGD